MAGFAAMLTNPTVKVGGHALERAESDLYVVRLEVLQHVSRAHISTV